MRCHYNRDLVVCPRYLTSFFVEINGLSLRTSSHSSANAANTYPDGRLEGRQRIRMNKSLNILLIHRIENDPELSEAKRRFVDV